MNKYINKNMNIIITCSTVLVSFCAHTTFTRPPNFSEDTNHQLTQSNEKTTGKITSFLSHETNSSKTFMLPSLPGLSLRDNVDNLNETSSSHSTPTLLGKRTFSQLQNTSQQDVPTPKKKRRKTASASYRHLPPEDRESIKKYIQANPDATGKDIAQYATDQLGVELNSTAASKLKSNTNLSSSSYSYLSPEHMESIKKFIQDNPDAKPKDISKYAAEKLKVKLNSRAAGNLKNNTTLPSGSYSYLSPEQKKSIKKYIQDNPDAKPKDIVQYAADQLGVKLNSIAASNFKKATTSSLSYSHLTTEHMKSIKQFIQDNPDAKPKDIAQYATDQLGVELNNAAAKSFKVNLTVSSASYSHLTPEHMESIKKFIQNNPDAKPKDIAQYTADQLGVKLNNAAAYNFKRTKAFSLSYSHLPPEHMERIKQFIQDNPNANSKDISKYAADKLEVELNNEAARSLKTNLTVSSASYSHLTPEHMESINKYIQDNPNATGKDISQYAADQLGVELNSAAARSFKKNTTISRSLAQLNPEHMESITQFINDNPSAKGKDISKYATDQLGVELNITAANALKANMTSPQLYSHLTPENRKNIKQFIKDNPSAKGKDISKYATDQLGVELSITAANALKANMTTSRSYSYLTPEHKEKIVQYIQDNPDAKGKEISQYATNQLGVELNTAAAYELKRNTNKPSRSHSHLTPENRKSIKQFIKDNPNAKGKEISQYATNQLGVELNNEAANELKRYTTFSS